MPVSKLTTQDLILPRIIYDEIDATIFSLIKNADKARKMGVPTKRLVLLAGPYGTGKTLAASITANLCIDVNRTFLYLHDVSHLAQAIYFAQQYAPACIFAEDIDSVDDPDEIDEISNTIDGIDTKGIDTLFVLTTNHVDRIPAKFLRSGRSDMIIQMEPPDADAAARLIMMYGGKTLAHGFQYEDALEIGRDLAKHSMIPASIREVVERAKLFSLCRGSDEIDSQDLVRAGRGVGLQCEMLKERPEPKLPGHLVELGTLVRNRADGTFEAQLQEQEK